MDRAIKISLMVIVAFAIIVGTIGTLLNELVLTVNDGKMPVKVFIELGVIEDDTHQQLTEHTKLNLFSDIILIGVADENSSIFRKIIASEHPAKMKLWGEGMGVCPTDQLCVASVGDVMRWTFALLMTIFFVPFVFAAFHELLVSRRRR